MGDYLYFPENKLEYIPSVIMLVLIIIAAVYSVYLLKRISNRQLLKAKELEKQLNYELDDTEEQSKNPTS